jgi:hypothetical protein
VWWAWWASTLLCCSPRLLGVLILGAFALVMLVGVGAWVWDSVCAVRKWKTSIQVLVFCALLGAGLAGYFVVALFGVDTVTHAICNSPLTWIAFIVVTVVWLSRLAWKDHKAARAVREQRALATAPAPRREPPLMEALRARGPLYKLEDES